ncbi:conserved hypothetical protein [Candida dubliniensis CD36]|uniref:GSKIP domain-containing protein n=1 Tax=Candida dubliniensis (strain CD36 / ATCC MYA-646 / CBS 7987 / NCPF 3949 / NRRL Y-17841) TaxID=573826 RepID=B9WH69_CANDC|nr:conserved hypothetical protein [Candida dubliniensis CD36]CAX41510.1 conserved hypothetical protein [Candida dubliniensis CD36]
MEIQQQIEELTTIYHEYKSFFPKCELIVTPDIKSNSNSNYIQLITYEGRNIKVTVGFKGWYEITTTTTIRTIEKSFESFESFETFEALMQTISIDFQNRFGNELSNKLNQLLQQQQK